MGSESDLPVMNEASKFLDEMNLSYDIDIVSAHRTPKKMFAYAENAVENGINVMDKKFISNWPRKKIIVSKKDSSLMSFKKFCEVYKFL